MTSEQTTAGSDHHLPAEPAFQASWEDFRSVLMPYDSERLVTSRQLNLEDYSQTIISTERAQGLLKLWAELLAEPFRGITTDGVVREGLFALADEGFRPAPAVAAARALLETLTEAERSAIEHPLDAHQWREWYNPEWLVNSHGVRLDRARPETGTAAIDLVRACLSEEGFEKFERARSANLYLGEIYDLRHLMSEWTFHFLLFGTPSETEPWGWSMYGHHITLNCLVVGHQVVISPSFLGVEPTLIDRGGGDRFRLFTRESADGLALMRSLTPEQRARAVIFPKMHDPTMEPDRWHFADERHLGGAYRDNRIIPNEGVCVDEFTQAQRDALLEIAGEFLILLPDPVRARRLAQIEAYLDETWWSWIGACGDDDPFYYRIQSPVIMLEFDNHSGIWLTNTEPAKFHIHTIVRTPNGNDYGKSLVRQHNTLGA
jgi:hypothetical protein